MSTLLEVQNLYKVFGPSPEEAFPLIEQGLDKDEIFAKTGLTVGVNNVSLTINKGEVFVIMGLSGSGKSTLVRLLNRLIEPTSGKVLFQGKDIARISTEELRQVRRKHISMVFQNFALMPHMNVIDNAAFGLELSGIAIDERHQAAREALSRVGLEMHCESYPDELSGGMKQRVGLARALTNDPEILLMDEAFSALDPLIRCEMQDELIRLQNDDKRTIVFISHDLDEAMRIGDRIAIMQNGEVVQVGTPDDILQNPANDYVSSFFSGVNVATVFCAKDIAKKTPAAVFKKHENDSPAVAMQSLLDSHHDFGIVVDRANRFTGIVSTDSLRLAKKNQDTLSSALLENITTIKPDVSVSELIGQVAAVRYAVPVVAEDGTYHGVITKSRLLKILDRE